MNKFVEIFEKQFRIVFFHCPVTITHYALLHHRRQQIFLKIKLTNLKTLQEKFGKSFSAPVY